ncbi:helix-turn-helix transcriptional regulator [Actinomadura sp. LOL_016]|uniref:helix-turn-helix transcriptional regulator n=1 Tax=unclassified Actinomadura TaxID=2626254 RepID=UPI003A81347E
MASWWLAFPVALAMGLSLDGGPSSNVVERSTAVALLWVGIGGAALAPIVGLAAALSGGTAAPDTGTLLTLADAVRHRRPVSFRYGDREGRRADRTLHPYGIVSHSGRWYVTGEDIGVGEDRTFRLDRITDARPLPGSFEEPAGPDPAERVLSGFATASYRHEVTLRVHGTVEQIRARFPASIATMDGPADADDPAVERWHRVEVRAERLDWLPALLASLDRPFAIERPDEFRALVLGLAGRLSERARRPPTG